MVSFSRLVVSGLMAAAALAAPLTVLQKRSSGKRGAAYNDPSLISIVSTASWCYNWGDSAGGPLPSGVEYVPMIWGTKSFDGWSNAIESALSSGSKCILGFNEPDYSGQANMSPTDAVTYYKQYVTPYQNRAALGSPAVTNGNQANWGLDWLSQYLDICNGTCGQTFINIHWYSTGDNAGSLASDFEAHVNQAIALAEKHNIHEVWITEFGTVNVADSITEQFLVQALAFLEQTQAVTRYAYFMAGEGTLLNGNALSVIGSTYNSFI